MHEKSLIHGLILMEIETDRNVSKEIIITLVSFII